MRLRYPIILTLLVVVLVVGAVLAGRGVIDAMVFMNTPRFDDDVDAQDFGRAQAAFTTLLNLVPFAVLAAVIPAVGALVLLVLRSRERTAVGAR